MPKKIILKLIAGVDGFIERHPKLAIAIMLVLMVIEIIYFVIRDYNLMKVPDFIPVYA